MPLHVRKVARVMEHYWWCKSHYFPETEKGLRIPLNGGSEGAVGKMCARWVIVVRQGSFDGNGGLQTCCN
jgi:hypothetical protein